MKSQRFLFPKLRALRERIDKSGYDLGYISGVSAMSLYALETKPTNPRVQTLIYLAFALALESNTPPSKVFREMLDAPLFEPYDDFRKNLEAQRDQTS